jgi:hypothetical protein
VTYRTDDSKAKKVYSIVQVIQLARVKTPDDREWINSPQQWTRVKTPDDREWINSPQQWIGLDQLGNEVEITFTAPEWQGSF